MEKAINNHSSIMEEAFHYVNIMTTEAKVTLPQYMKHLALTIRFSKPEKEIKLKFVKVWTTPPSNNRYDREGTARTVELSFYETRMKLLRSLQAIWEDKTLPDGVPRKRKFDLPGHLRNIIKFQKKGRQLTELILAATVIVDYCLEYTTSPERNEKPLLAFVRDLFKNVSNLKNAWKLLEYLLRVKVSEEKATLNKVKNSPVNGETILVDAVHSLDPEKTRDWAVRMIHKHRQRKGDLFFSGLVTEKDAAAWAFQIIGHLYYKPDHKFAHDLTKLPLLYLKQPTKNEGACEISRHEKLMCGDQYSERPQKEDEKFETAKDDKSDDPTGELKKNFNSDEEHSKKPPLVFDFNSDGSDVACGADKNIEDISVDPPNNNILASVGIAVAAADETVAEDKDKRNQNSNEHDNEGDDKDDNEKSNKDFNSAGSDVACGVVENIKDVSIDSPNNNILASVGTVVAEGNETVAEEKDNENQNSNEHDNQWVNNDDNEESNKDKTRKETMNMIDTEGPNKRLDPIIKWKNLASCKDMKTRHYSLEYFSTDRVKCVFELGKMDHIHCTRLEQVPHILSNSSDNMQGSENTQENKRGGLLSVRRDDTHMIYDYGIFRHDDPIMKKHRDLLLDIDFDLILGFMCKHGCIDSKRDKWKNGGGYAIQPLRISFGSADHYLRDLPKNDCGVASMTKFNINLPKEIGKLMDFEALLLRDKFKSINTPKEGVLQDGFIYSVFTEPFVKLFSCVECRFPCFDLMVMDAEDSVPDEIGKYHTDGDNGILAGNDISATLSLFFRSKKIVDSLVADGVLLDEAEKKAELLLHGKEDVERLKRLYMTFFTRRVHEQFRDNETMAEHFKMVLRTFRDKLDREYKVFGGSFARPQDIFFPQEAAPSSLSNELINGVVYACYKMSPSYAREIYCAGGMTILYSANVILAKYGKTRHKMLELYVVALSMGSWFKFYYSGIELLVTMKDHVDDNLIVLLLQAMESKFGSWNGGPQHRGRPTATNLLLYYEDAVHVETAVTAMEKFLVFLANKPNLKLKDFKIELMIMVSSLPGVGEHYGMNFGLYAGLTGLLSTNIHNCFLAYPIEGQGSANTLEEHNKTLQGELDVLRSKDGISGQVVDRIKEIGLKADLKGYHQTIRLVSSFCGIEQRHYWVETICCDGIGPNQTKFDYAFPGQSIFWFHSENGREDDIRRMTFIARRKQWGSQIWTDVQKFI
jgi:hypothetical protein